MVVTDRMHLSGHIQGYYLRTLAEGRWDFPTTLWPYFQRIQLNFHGVALEVSDLFYAQLLQPFKQFIFQMDGVNEAIYYKAMSFPDINIVPLYDASAGEGILPETWREPVEHKYNGYAGGLGPDNLQDQLYKIAQVVGPLEIWIDMETRLRGDNDVFDLEKCRQVMRIVKEFNDVK